MRGGKSRGERGVAMVEFALLAPVLLLIVFGIVEMGMLFNAWVSVQHASELGARYAVTGRDTCTSGGSGRVGCIISEARAGVANLSNGGSATVTVTSWAFPAYTAATSGSAGQQCDAVEVQVQYTYQTMVPLISSIFSAVGLTGRQRFINEPFGSCHAT